MAKSQDQCPQVLEHSTSVGEARSKRLKFVGHCARMNSYTPQLVCQLVMWEPKAKGRRGMGAKRTYPDTILRDCGMQTEDRLVLWKAMHDKDCWRSFSQM